jgi:hypothetical protein
MVADSVSRDARLTIEIGLSRRVEAGCMVADIEAILRLAGVNVRTG